MRNFKRLAGVLFPLALLGCGQMTNSRPAWAPTPSTFPSEVAGQPSGTGLFAVALTNAWQPDVAGIVVTLDAVMVRSDQSGWVKVSDAHQSIDLLSLEDRTMELGKASIPSGEVDRIRLVLAAGPQYVVLRDGTRMPLKVPSGQESGLKVKGHFSVRPCQEHTVTIDFGNDSSLSLHRDRHGSEWILRPALRAEAEADQGSLCADAGTDVMPDAGAPPIPDAGQTTVSLSVPATADIFSANLQSAPIRSCLDSRYGGGDTLPPSVPVSSGSTVTFPSVTGGVRCVAYVGLNLADGPCFGGMSTNLESSDGISGIVDADSNMFLVGVFTTDSASVGTVPEALNFSSDALGQDFDSLAPALNQQFFIGDGHTSTGELQEFFVPDGATELQLGFADGYNFVGTPGCYGDNYDALTATVHVAP